MAARPRGQTIVTQVGTRTTVATPITRPRSVASTPMVSGAHATTRLLSENKRRISELEGRALSNIFGNGVLLRNLKVNASPTVTYIQHRLGRPYTGYIVTRAVGNTLATVAVEQALPANMSNSVWLALIFQIATNTYDLWVF